MWKKDVSSKPKSGVSAGGTSNKAEYFRQREKDIAEREKANAEKKKKYSSGGMKYTAQIMANSTMSRS
jgi:hypothetical protein